MPRISPSALQSFNNDLVRGLEALRNNRDKINAEIEDHQRIQTDLEQKLKDLSGKLEGVNSSLAQKQLVKKEYDRLIDETEVAYNNIVESSQALLNVLQNQSRTLQTRSPLRQS